MTISFPGLKLKVCGLTQADNAQALARLGVDALGLVFYEHSKRAVSIAQLTWLYQLPAFVQLVALFVNPDANHVKQVLAELPIDVLQFHGEETEAFCRQFNRRYIKAVPMQRLESAPAVIDYLANYPSACGFLLDNYGTSEQGGSGQCFDWQALPALLQAIKTAQPQTNLILAGGISPENISILLKACEDSSGNYLIDAIDVSSGVESSVGVKSLDKVQTLLQHISAV